ncbi:DUF448 domain-containing protein [Thalassiella azotivora]
MARDDGAAAAGSTPDVVVVVPDPRRRLPGRGAWLHPDPVCLDLAERRRALARALRTGTAVDAGPVRAHLESGSTGS